MPRIYGYSKRGTRCFGKQDWGAKGRSNVIGALLGKELLTLSIFDCTIDTDIFSTWILEDLLPKLPKQSILVMDNASFHKGTKMQKAIAEIENHKHKILYLPTYSPDLNPIEKKWAQAKAVRRKIGCSTHELFAKHIL